MKYPYDYQSTVVSTKGRIERYWNIPSENISGLIPPVMVAQVGSAEWDEGSSFRRDYYYRLGIELVVAGNARYIQSGEEFIIEPGSLYIKLPGKTHFYETGPAGKLYKRFVTISGPKLERMIEHCGLSGLSTLKLSDSRSFVNHLKQVIRIMQHQPSDYFSAISSLAYKIMYEIGHEASLSQYPQEIASVLNYMQQNIRWWVTPQDCAKRAGMSVAQLYRFFDQHLGMAPMTFFRQQKTKFACDLLNNSTFTIKQVALMLGYEDPLYFSTQFKKFMGKSPKHYRQKN